MEFKDFGRFKKEKSGFGPQHQNKSAHIFNESIKKDYQNNNKSTC